MAGSAIATAYVQIIPTTSGIGSAISKEFSGVGEESGKNLSDGVKTGFSRNFAFAGAIAGAVSAVTSQVISSVSDIAGQAIKASDATDKFKKTLDFAGLDTKSIENLSKSTQGYADSTVYSLGDIQNITAQLASNGVTDYDKLAEAAGNLNAISGGNADTFKSVGMVLTQTAGAGKLTTENWNQLANAIPGASGKMQDALEKNGAFTGNFRDAMAEGQITSEEFNTALLELGNDPIAVEAAKSTDTFEGAMGNLQATLTGELATALTDMKPMITDALGGLGDLLTGIGDGMQWMKDNANLAIPIIAALGGVLLVALAPAIWAGVVATWAFTVALLANPLTWIALAVGALIGVIILLAMNWDVVTKWISDVWGGFVGWLTDGLNAFMGWWNGLWTGVWEFIVSVWDNIVTSVVGFFTGLWDGIVAIGDGIATWWNGLWEGMVGFFETIFSGIGDFVGGIFTGAMNIIIGALNWGIDIINGLIGGINVLLDGVRLATNGTVDFHVNEIPNIPGLATGGTITSSGTVLVGEQGPELLNLGRGASVIPLDKASGQTIVYNAAPNTSLDSEQALFTAMRRAKVVGW